MIFLLFFCFCENCNGNLRKFSLKYDKNSLCERMALFSKINCFQNLSVSERISSMNLFLLIPLNWVEQHFVDILKTSISLAAIKCHLYCNTNVQSYSQYQSKIGFILKLWNLSFTLAKQLFSPLISWLSIKKMERSRTYG